MKEIEFQNLIQNSQPHQVFNLDWSMYYSIDFADTFLPKVGEYRGRSFHFFDGAELLSLRANVVQNELKLNNSKELISAIFYSYPKGVEAEKKKERVQIESFVVASFLEIYQDNTIEIYFKFGDEFKNFLSNYIKEYRLNATVYSIENKTYSSTVQKVHNFFNKEISHFSMMEFLGNTIGINLVEAHYRNILKLISINAITSEPSKSTKYILSKKNQEYTKGKYIAIDFEILNQFVTGYTFYVYDGSKKVYSVNYLPEIIVKPDQESDLIDDNYFFKTGKHQIVWDCTNNNIFETNDFDKQLTFRIEARTETKLISFLTKRVNVKELIDKSNTNDFILIVNPIKKEDDEEALLRVYADEIIQRQEDFINKIPKNTYNKLSDESKLILDLPVIMVKLGWIYSALCQIHWLEGSKESLKLPYDFFVSEERVHNIDIKNLKKYFKGIKYLSIENLGYSPSNPDGINLFLFNEYYESIKKSLELFHKTLTNKNGQYEIIGDFKELTTEITNKLPAKDNFFQSFSEGSAFGDKDDLGGAVGKYSQRCYFKANLEKNYNDKWLLIVDEVGCRFFDEFSFNDKILGVYSQPLGCWNENTANPELPTRLSISPSKVCIQNKDYLILKKTLNEELPTVCNDFYIYSDIRVFTDDFIKKSILII